MNQTLKWTGLVLLAVAVGPALAFAFAAGFRGQTPAVFVQRAVAQATPYPSDSGRPPGGQYGYGGWEMRPGMMVGGGYRADTWGYANNNAPLTLDQAVEAANQYLATYGNPDLVLTEMMEFSDNFYAEVEEQSSGVHAFELLIDRYSGAVYPEPSPNIMWNTKYGHMGGSSMMGGLGRLAGRTDVRDTGEGP